MVNSDTSGSRVGACARLTMGGPMGLLRAPPGSLERPARGNRFHGNGLSMALFVLSGVLFVLLSGVGSFGALKKARNPTILNKLTVSPKPLC